MKRKYKVAKTEYTKSMLPQTRRAVFFDVIQLQWRNLLLLGLLLLLFYIPALLSGLIKDIAVSSLYASVDTGDAAQGAALSAILLDILFCLIGIVLIAVFAAGFSGVLRIIRQHAWGENVHTPTDFIKGIRDNYGQTVGIGILGGLIYTLCVMVRYYAAACGTQILSMALSIPIALSALVIAPILAVAIAMIPIYKNSLWSTLKNAFYVYWRSCLKVTGSFVGCLLPWFIPMIPNFYCHAIGGIAAVLLTPVSLLAWCLLCYNRFDEHINPLVSPQLIGKGVYK